MRKNRSMPESVVIPVLSYSNISEAVEWFCRSFGFKERLRIGDHRVQLSFGENEEGAIVITAQSGAHNPESNNQSSSNISYSIMVRVDNIDSHFEQSIKCGVQIVNPLTDYPYGERQYTAIDLSGRVWIFSQTISDVDPTAWGGKLLK